MTMASTISFRVTDGPWVSIPISDDREKVDLSESSIEEITFIGCENVKDLDISFNNITSVPATLPKNLSKLNIGGNCINTLKGLEDTGIKVLHAFFCGLTSLDYCPKEIEELDVSANELRANEDGFTELESLKSVDAVSCGLKKSPEFNDGIESVDISLNKITNNSFKLRDSMSIFKGSYTSDNEDCALQMDFTIVKK